MGFDDQYRSTRDVFGSEPERSLVEHISLISRDRPVLDLGAGQGRNTLHLARAGHEVHAVDPSPVATESLRVLAERDALPIRAFAQSFERFRSDVDAYAAILAFGLVPLLSWASIDAMCRFVERWLAPGGVAFVTAFTTDDDSHARYRRAWTERGPNSYVGPEGNVRTYLEAGQLPSLLPQLEVVHLWEGLGPEHRHGNGPLERHAWVEGVFRRR